MDMHSVSGAAPAPAAGQPAHRAARVLDALLRWLEYLSAAVLGVDVLVVFVSVVFRYFLHDPVDWAEEVASALMIVLVFFGAATVLGRSQHVGIDVFRGRLPARWQGALIQVGHWIVAAVALNLLVSSCQLLTDSYDQLTTGGLPGWINGYPMMFGALFMTVFALANALNAPRRRVIGTFA
ncbi:C4-dicarboxylate ABC transporter permease, partial [Burkholderia cenocepacia]